MHTLPDIMASSPLAAAPEEPAWKLNWLTPGVCRAIFVALLAFGVLAHVRYLTHDCPIGLSGDEAQYWDWSRQLGLSYYSKGPLVAYIIRASCWAFGSDSMLAVRFPAILLGAGTSILTYLLTRRLFNSERLALGAVLLCYIVPMFVAGSALMTIDPPFYFCWALATYLAAIAIFTPRRWLWPVIGAIVGLGFLAKYAMPLWFLLALGFMATDRRARQQLRSPWLWIGVAAWLPFTIPVLVWNAQHDWGSLMHVAEQTGANQHGTFHLDNVVGMFGGQIGAVGPGLFLFMIGGVLCALGFRQNASAHDIEHQDSASADAARGNIEPTYPPLRQLRFLAWFGVGFFAINFLASFRTKVQVNWPAPAYFTLTILAAYFLATRLRSRTLWRPWRWWFYATVAFGLLISPIAHNSNLLYPPMRWLNAQVLAWRRPGGSPVLAWVGRRFPKEGLTARRFDFSAKLKGWPAIADRLSMEIQSLGPGAFVMCEDYQENAAMAFYMKGQPRTYYVGSYLKGDLKRLTQYDMWPDRTLAPPNPRIGCNAVFLGHIDVPIASLRQAFDRVEGVTVLKQRMVDNHVEAVPEQRALCVTIEQDDMPVRTFRYFRCYGFKGVTRPSDNKSY